MTMLRRFFLFFLVNGLVVITLSVVMNVLGVGNYLTPYGIDYTQMAVFCLLWGMGGAFISLLMSRAIAKWSSGVQLIDPNTNDPSLRFIVNLIHDLSQKAGLSTMPEIGIYDSPEPNAFATGPSKSRALVAVSTGLLSRMNQNEIAGVLGHEITHISNGDMVTMTLLQGVVNAFVMFLSRVIAFAVTSRGRDDERSPGFLYYIVQIALEVVFMILGSIVVAWFSRWREYRADAGGAKLAGKRNMIEALEELRRTYELVPANGQPIVQTLQISSRPSGLMALFASHPPLEQRIAKLQESVEG
ncbi:MAG: protease HtpX [Candidatus Obscuribacterales bacterium]|nr:protease HtpX [Candidatus Obscuribacterales bacterium]